jgi:phosphoesterase RecJ-like protein
MSSSVLKQIHEKLIQAKQPLLVADERLDGDSLGSSLATADYLLRLGRPVRLFISEALPKKYQNLPHHHLCFSSFDELAKLSPDLVVSFDCSDAKYIGKVIAALSGPAPFVINIDHHVSNPRFGQLCLVEPGAAATCEIIIRFFQENGIAISQAAASCLFSGLIFDTTVFSNSVTNARVLAQASEMLLLGGRGDEAIRLLLKDRSLSALRVWGVAMERLFHHQEWQATATAITREDMETFGVNEEDLDGLANYLHWALAVDTTCVFRETKDGGVKVSLRTRDGDVAAIARVHGGGGHTKAAGFTIKDSRLVCQPDGCWRIMEMIK